MNILPYKDIVSRLRPLGLTKTQVRALLPTWWDDDAAQTPAGAWEFAVMIGRRLELDAVALAQGDVRSLQGLSQPRYKHTVRVAETDLVAATRIASSLARAVVGSFPAMPPSARMTAEEARAKILSAQPGVDFDGLLAFAWNQSIPVIPLPHLPKGVKKMDAAALRVGGRPVIVIARKNDSKAWLSFVLAHELGHVMRGHLPEDGAIVEGSLQDTAAFDAESQQDAQECEANAFAHHVLSGPQADAVIQRWGTRASPLQLVDAANAAADALQTAPAHLVLRYAFLTRRWVEANVALKFMAEDVNAQQTLVQRMAERIDTRAIGEDLQEFVEQITGVSASAA